MALLPIFPHMPTHIKENIIERLHFEQKTRFRRCSKEFKQLVDTSETSFKSFNVRMIRRGFEINIAEGLREYEFKFERGLLNQIGRRIFETREPESPNENGHDDFIVMSRIRKTNHSLGKTEPLDAMFGVIAYLFRDVSKMNIENFSIDFDHRNLHIPPLNFFDRLQTVLSNSNNNLLSVKQLSTDQNNILKVLPYLKPGTLQKLTFKTNRFDYFNSDEMQHLPQWQQAACIRLTSETRNVNYDFLSDFKFAAFHCNRPNLEQLKHFITKAEERGDQFEHLHITGNNDEIQQYIESNFSTRPDNQRYHYKIHPTLNFCLRFSVGPNGNFLQIRRVSSTTFQPTDDRFLDLR